jgi:hypothetical protein
LAACNAAAALPPPPPLVVVVVLFVPELVELHAAKINPDAIRNVPMRISVPLRVRPGRVM